MKINIMSKKVHKDCSKIIAIWPLENKIPILSENKIDRIILYMAHANLLATELNYNALC